MSLKTSRFHVFSEVLNCRDDDGDLTYNMAAAAVAVTGFVTSDVMMVARTAFGLNSMAAGALMIFSDYWFRLTDILRYSGVYTVTVTLCMAPGYVRYSRQAARHH